MSDALTALVNGLPSSGAVIVVADTHARENIRKIVQKLKGAKVDRFSKYAVVTTPDMARAQIGGQKLPVVVDPAFWAKASTLTAAMVSELTGIAAPARVETPPAEVRGGVRPRQAERGED